MIITNLGLDNTYTGAASLVLKTSGNTVLLTFPLSTSAATSQQKTFTSASPVAAAATGTATIAEWQNGSGSVITSSTVNITGITSGTQYSLTTCTVSSSPS